MAQDKCIDRVSALLKKSSITSSNAEEIIQDIKKLQRESKIENIDATLKEDLANKVLSEQQINKKIKERNALENEIKVRKAVDRVLVDFKGREEEGLSAILVGSNLQKTGSRASVALSQITESKIIMSAFNEKLRKNNLTELFANANEDIDRRIARTMWELDLSEKVTETNKDIISIATIMKETSESVRNKLNNMGSNIDKLPGWIVRQSHDPYQIRNAADVLKFKNNKDNNVANGNYDRNLEAWKQYILPKLDERTFGDIKDPVKRNEFLNYVYNSVSRNEHAITEGSSGVYGSRDITTKMNSKRVLHFKTADDWFDYNSKFGYGNLRESFYFGTMNSAKNIGLIDVLGTKPSENFERIKGLVVNKLTKDGKSIEAINKNTNFHKNQLLEVTGATNGIANFSVAKWSAIARSIQNMSKLGGAVFSSIVDLHTYASEVKSQGRGYMTGLQESMVSLSRMENTKMKTGIAEQLGFINDSMIYSLAGRYSTGDALNSSFTKLQGSFFKLNLLRWWTDSLREGSVLGLGNYVAKQRSIAFNSLDAKFKNLLNNFGVDEKIWNTIRKLDIEKSEDGKEFFSVKNIDNLSKEQMVALMDIKNPTQRQIDLYRDSLKTKITGIFLDRSSYAVIEPDARTRAFMKQGLLAGTPMGEALRFVGQFKAFPIAFLQKALGRDVEMFRANKTAAEAWGIANLIVGATLFGYISMTVADLLKGKGPKDPTDKDTWFAAMARGGGLGIYGDFLFNKTKTAGDLLATAAGPTISESVKLFQAFKYGLNGEKDSALRQAYKSITGNIPFLNLFYTKVAFDYMIGYQMLETLSPGYLKKMEKQMKKDTGQEFLLTKPSVLFKGF
jgi:hypothetical protein